MKPDDDDQLLPQQIDDQIEWLVQRTQEGTLENNLNAQLVQHLQRHYESEKQKKTLQRAWKSIVQKYENGVSSSMEEEHARNEQSKLEGSGQYTMHERTMKILPIKRVLPRWGTLAAVAVLVLVIGSTALILSHAAVQRNGNPGTGGGGGHSVCPPTPTLPPGHAKVTPTPVATAAPCGPPICPPTPTLPPGRAKVTPTPAATAVSCGPTTAVPTAPPGSKLTPMPTEAPVPLPTVAPPGSKLTPMPTVAPTARPTGAPIAPPTPQPGR